MILSANRNLGKSSFLNSSKESNGCMAVAGLFRVAKERLWRLKGHCVALVFCIHPKPKPGGSWVALLRLWRLSRHCEALVFCIHPKTEGSWVTLLRLQRLSWHWAALVFCIYPKTRGSWVTLLGLWRLSRHCVSLLTCIHPKTRGSRVSHTLQCELHTQIWHWKLYGWC